ncbi:hypothetical protein OJF2_77250 [Aquisphaera giovannonii]|uniref:Uncharacterized protein n=1 Tax=Aquisphaera giovannonii TaxID=406548 RepID=A0A5B9WF62_9BACT|nr:hypothetical protein [Aquisphaera giovannonii]QEH39113.1 hypothetical protein OJF2_77250 [Aquisphaera giovannonii]
MADRPYDSPDLATTPGDRAWFLSSRVQDYRGEARVNLLRLVAIAAFYLIELASHHGVSLGPLAIPAAGDRAFHAAATALAAGWVSLAAAVQLGLGRGILPAALKYVTTGLDVVLLTALLMIADGPRSPLVAGYFLILAASAMRFRLSLVWFATAGVMAGYAWLQGWALWLEPHRDVRVPRYHQLIVLTALGLCGIIQGQVIRRVRAMVVENAARLAATPGATDPTGGGLP